MDQNAEGTGRRACPGIVMKQRSFHKGRSTRAARGQRQALLWKDFFMKIKMQIARLYGLEFLTAFGLAQVIWLALLAGRGFSLAQIGLAEGFFHLVSFLCEVPSGMIADLLGRKRTLVAACLVRAAAALCMVASRGLLGVCGAPETALADDVRLFRRDFLVCRYAFSLIPVQ